MTEWIYTRPLAATGEPLPQMWGMTAALAIEQLQREVDALKTAQTLANDGLSAAELSKANDELRRMVNAGNDDCYDMSSRVVELKAENAALRDAVLAFHHRWGKWILAQPESTALSSALAFGREYEALLDAAGVPDEQEPPKESQP